MYTFIGPNNSLSITWNQSPLTSQCGTIYYPIPPHNLLFMSKSMLKISAYNLVEGALQALFTYNHY